MNPINENPNRKVDAKKIIDELNRITMKTAQASRAVNRAAVMDLFVLSEITPQVTPE
jgi:hypothetical protein